MFFSNLCSLCLTYNKNVIPQISMDSTAREIFECIIPEHVLRKTEIPIQMCQKCINNLNDFLNFRQRCVENIISFNEYALKLKQQYGTNKYLSVTLNDNLNERNCEISHNNHKDDGSENEAPNYKIKVKKEISDTVDYSNSLAGNIYDNTEKIEHIEVKCENLMDDFYVKKEVDEEGIKMREDPCAFEENMQINCLEMKPEHSYNVGTHFINEEKQDKYFSGRYANSDFINQNDSQSAYTDMYKAEWKTQNVAGSEQMNYSECYKVQPEKLNNILVEEQSNTCHTSTRTCKLPENRVRPRKKPGEPKIFECYACQKIFTRSGDLRQHELIHSEVKPYECDVCQKTFTQMGNLNIHKRIHSDEKPFACDLCDKSFKRFHDLKQHKRIHSGEKPYSCDVCLRRFAQTGALNIHRRSHSNEKPYPCDICHKSFKRSSDLKQHKRIHSGEKPFTCDICQKSFVQFGNLKTHKRTHNSINQNPDDLSETVNNISQHANDSDKNISSINHNPDDSVD